MIIFSGFVSHFEWNVFVSERQENINSYNVHNLAVCKKECVICIDCLACSCVYVWIALLRLPIYYYIKYLFHNFHTNCHISPIPIFPMLALTHACSFPYMLYTLSEMCPLSHSPTNILSCIFCIYVPSGICFAIHTPVLSPLKARETAAAQLCQRWLHVRLLRAVLPSRLTCNLATHGESCSFLNFSFSSPLLLGRLEQTCLATHRFSLTSTGQCSGRHRHAQIPLCVKLLGIYISPLQFCADFRANSLNKNPKLRIAEETKFSDKFSLMNPRQVLN